MDFGQIGSDGDDVEVMDDNASLSSEDSNEPYYHVVTGKIFPAREAWKVLAAEGHSKYQKKLSGGGAASNNNSSIDNPNPSSNERGGTNNANSVFREDDNDNANAPPPSTPVEEYPETDDLQRAASPSGPTQSSIDKALHPESPNYISPQKHLKNSYKKSASSQIIGGCNAAAVVPNLMDVPAPIDDEADSEIDPIVLRAKAMALAAQNGQKLTPEQMQLIAQPDVQQQKLIEEAKRVHRAKEMQMLAAQSHSQHGGGGSQMLAAQSANLREMGADFKKFIEKEKDKTPLQWGADLGKFIETQSFKIANQGNAVAAGAGAGGDGESVDGREDGDGGGENNGASKTTTPATSPRPKKKMEGFGTDPLAPRVSPGAGGSKRPSMASNPSSIETSTMVSSSVKWPSMNIGMPPLPLLNESITNILPGVGKSERKMSGLEEPVRVSGILWKRRSGFGKHSTLKAWERRRVELRGSKLIYYKSAEEEEEEDAAKAKNASAAVAANSADNSGFTTPREPSIKADSEADAETTVTTNNNADVGPGPVASKRLSIFGQAAQAAEQRLQNAKDELSRLATVTGLEHLSNPLSSSPSADSPRGNLDLRKENVSISASVGHSGAPTPFCISIKVKTETKWKFCFDSHGALMEWLSAMTDVLVKKSVDYKAKKHEEVWELEDYCVQRGEAEKLSQSEGSDNTTSEIATPSEAQSSVTTSAVSVMDGTQWMISGTNLQIAWAVANVALIIARSSSTSIDRYWILIVFTNFGIWQLCTRPKASAPLHSIQSTEIIEQIPGSAPGSPRRTPRKIPLKPKPGYKPIAGNTTMQVAKVEDPNINENGDQLPSWVPVTSSILDVRSHGYLSSKKKISSPGELYECVAVDCFVSNTRFPEIAPRVRLPQNVKFDDDAGTKTWKSPDLFIVSIAIPTEAPRFGQSTDDGPGVTMVGYFKMKKETREILRRITADGYDLSADTSDSEADVQKRIVSGVRLWEQYCNQAPNDPSFQARFKLIPLANLEELGCPSYIAKYNGKPVLIKRNQVTGFFNDYPSLNVMEFDISLHPFPYLFKQAMSYLKDYFDNLVATFGFVIEGRNDSELPEVVIGAMNICKPNPKFVVKGEEFFNGTCPKSTPQEST